MTPHTIEAARSGRSACRVCKQKIANGALRFGLGHAQENGSFSHQWFHLDCAATDRFLELEEALADTALTIPTRAALEQTIAGCIAAQPAVTYPRAVVGDGLDPFLCAHCDGWSFPGTIRVLSPRQVTIGAVTLQRNVQVHHGCANDFFGDPALLQTVIANSALDADALAWLKDGLT